MRIPKMSLHRGTGQARLVFKGKHYYLGKFGSKEAEEAYRKIVAKVVEGKIIDSNNSGISLAVAMVQFLDYAHGYYGIKEAGNIKTALRTFAKKFGAMDLKNIGPSIVVNFLTDMANTGKFTRYRINKLLAVWKRFYRWMVVKEIIAPDKLVSMAAIPGIKLGRTNAIESTPVKAPPMADFEAMVAAAPPHVADLCRLQLLMGCRPGELLSLKPGLMDRSKPVWVYTPEKHKNSHRGHQRKILIGPQAQGILAKYLFRKDDEWCWPAKIEGMHYQVHSFEQELKRVCKRAGIAKILPNQIRHLAATLIHERYGWESARQILGHRTVGTTQFYVEELLANAAKVAEQMG